MITVHNLEEHRTALTGHCYRMLGSAAEADDAVQETMVRAWRSLERFEERASLRTWLYRIATRVCLDALTDGSPLGRTRPMELGPAGTICDQLTALPGSRWIEPIPDASALPADSDPAELVGLRQSIRLAFVAALQHLPPRQRAVLLLTEVLGWSAAEIAGSLEISTAAVNSALQRARATLAAREPGREPESAQAAARPELSGAQSTLLNRYVEAFERYDMEALSTLLHEDATLCMPPYSLWLRGREPIRGWLLGPGSGCRGSRLIPTAACGSPAFAQYRPAPAGEAGYRAFALIVLEIAGERIAAMNSFLDTESLFPRFALPAALAK